MSKMTKEAAERGIVKVPVCKTTDGSIFENNESALEHQREIDFDTWYLERVLCGDDIVDDGFDNIVRAETIRNWLTENRAEILRFLGV